VVGKRQVRKNILLDYLQQFWIGMKTLTLKQQKQLFAFSSLLYPLVWVRIFNSGPNYKHTKK